MAFSKDNTSHFLKRVYPPKTRDIIGVKAGALLQMVKTNERGFGESYDVGMENARMVSSGADFTKAQTLAKNTAVQGKKFNVTEVSHYTIARIEGNLIRKARAGNDGMLKERLVKAAKRAFETHTHRMSRWVYGQGYGALASIGSIDTTTTTDDTITLANKTDALMFDEDMEIGFVTNTSESAAMRDSGEVETVLSVDRPNGKVIFDVNLSTEIASIAVGDFLVIDGDRGTGASPTKLLPTGYSGWVPASAPSPGESFFGVDRSSDSRLYGNRLAALGMSKREAYIEAAFLSMNDGDMLSHIFTHPANFKELVKEAEGTTWLTQTQVTSRLGIGLRAAVLHAEFGDVTIVMDRYASKDFDAGVRLEDWELRSEGKAPDFMTFDDGNLITVGDGDQAELRVGGDLNMICHAPNNQVYIDHTT